MTILLLLVLGWLVSAVLTVGLRFAYLQGKYPEIAKRNYWQDLGDSWSFGLIFGPVGLVTAFIWGRFAKYGWRLK